MTAADLAALWEPLAARAPELRPEGLALFTSKGLAKMNAESALYYDQLAQKACEAGNLYEWRLHSETADTHRKRQRPPKWLPVWTLPSAIDGMRSNITPEQAAALWRDSAVRWLASDRRPVPVICHTFDHVWKVQAFNGRLLGLASTLDDALAEAVKAVLDAAPVPA